MGNAPLDLVGIVSGHEPALLLSGHRHLVLVHVRNESVIEFAVAICSVEHPMMYFSWNALCSAKATLEPARARAASALRIRS